MLFLEFTDAAFDDKTAVHIEARSIISVGPSPAGSKICTTGGHKFYVKESVDDVMTTIQMYGD